MSGWSISLDNNDFEKRIICLVDSWRSKHISSLVLKTVKKIKKGTDQILEPLFNLEEDMWEKMSKRYEQIKFEQIEIFKDILMNGFKTT